MVIFPVAAGPSAQHSAGIKGLDLDPPDLGSHPGLALSLHDVGQVAFTWLCLSVPTCEMGVITSSNLERGTLE